MSRLLRLIGFFDTSSELVAFDLIFIEEQGACIWLAFAVDTISGVANAK